MEFIRSEYDKYDHKAKEILAKYLQSIGHIPTIKTEDFSFDMYSTIPHPGFPGVIWRWEAEMKKDVEWTSREDFPFDTVSFLARKNKYHNNFWYAIICDANKKHIVIAHSRSVYQLGERKERTINKDTRSGKDVFYLVPKKCCFWVSLKEF